MGFATRLNYHTRAAIKPGGLGGFAGQGTLQAEEAALHVTLKPIIDAGGLSSELSDRCSTSRSAA